MAYQKNPTLWPHVTETSMDTGVSIIKFWIALIDEAAFTAFKMNKRHNLDAIVLRDVAKERKETGVTLADLRAAVKDGATFVEPPVSTPDGEGEFACIVCRKNFQPMLTPVRDGKVKGNFTTLRRKEVEVGGKERLTIATEVTKWFLGLVETDVLPERETLVAPHCVQCREEMLYLLYKANGALIREHEVAFKAGNTGHELRLKFVPRFVGLDHVVEELDVREAKITGAIVRKEEDADKKRFLAVVARIDGDGGDRRPADNRHEGHIRGDRPRPEQGKWHGGLFHLPTVKALEADEAKGGVSSLEALAGLSPAELVTRGIAPHELAATAIIRKASSGIDYVARNEAKEHVARGGRVSFGLGEVVQAHKR